MMTITKRGRDRGAMVGVLCGDARGAAYETWNSRDILADMKKRGGLVPFEYPDPWSTKIPPTMWPPGRPTDDSDHTAALAECFIANRGLSEEDLFNRLRHVVRDHVSPLWSGKAVGAGRTTRKMLRPLTYRESCALPRDDEYPSNGSLMRSAPLALFFGTRDKIDPFTVFKASAVTHRHPTAATCSHIYVEVLTGLLNEESVENIIEAIIPYALDDEVIAILEDPFDLPIDPGQWPERGSAAFTLHVALWSLLTSKNYQEGITKAVAIGGDTDTYGAVAGGLLGAKFGIQGIPQDWLDVLIGREKMIELADHLYDIAHS